MSTRLAEMLEGLEAVDGDLSKVVGLIEAEHVPVYDMEVVLLAVAALAVGLRDRALEACGEVRRIVGEIGETRPEGAASHEATRRYINTLLTSQLLTGGAG